MPKNKVFLMSDIISECSILDCVLFWNRTMKLCLKLWFQNSYDWVCGWFHIRSKPMWLQVVVERDYFGHHFFLPQFPTVCLCSFPWFESIYCAAAEQAELAEPIYLSSTWLVDPSQRMGWNVWLEVKGRSCIASSDTDFQLHCIICNIKLHM